MAAQLAGAGEVVLTRLARASATLEVPPGRERYLVFATPSAAVLGELTGDEVPRLALPPGPHLCNSRIDFYIMKPSTTCPRRRLTN